MVAIQAQDYPAAKRAIGLRLSKVTDNDIEKAITDRTIVRTWLMRGTLHFVAAEDIYWILELLGPHIIEKSKLRHVNLGLDNETFEKSSEVFSSALSGGKQLTRDEMYTVLEEAGISVEGQRGYHILWRTALNGLICFGPLRGKQQTFVLLKEWIPNNSITVPDKLPLAELAMRYFTSRGPATLKDFAWWSGLKIKDAKAGLKAAESELEEFVADGQTYWMSSFRQKLSGDVHKTYLLPGFDEFILGYRDRGAILQGDFRRIVPWNNGMISPVIIVNGKIAGTWKRTFNKGTVHITSNTFIRLDKTEQNDFIRNALRYGQFLSMPVEIM